MIKKEDNVVKIMVFDKKYETSIIKIKLKVSYRAFCLFCMVMASVFGLKIYVF